MFIKQDLGLLKYPLIHPPDYYYWMAAPLPDLSLLLDRGETIDFEICHTEPGWQRPARQLQQATIWSKRPFSERSQEWLEGWFSRPAVLYNSQAQFEQSYPDGPNLDPLTADWRYLLGLWTDTNFEFEPGPGQSHTHFWSYRHEAKAVALREQSLSAVTEEIFGNNRWRAALTPNPSPTGLIFTHKKGK